MYAHDLAKQLLAGPDLLVGTAFSGTSGHVTTIDRITTATVAEPTESDEIEADETIVVLDLKGTTLTAEEMDIVRP
jgi:hypothetical protein